MKKATSVIIDKIPSLKKHVTAEQNVFLRQQALNELGNDVERAFMELIWFFEEPEVNNFDLRILYKSLNDDWLKFAIDVIGFYFKEDTYLIKNSTDSIIISDDYLDQNGASRYLEAKGISNFTQNKIATYIYRGKFPKEDLLISGKKFWKTSTIDKYAMRQIEKQ